ncbi:transketolase, partial [Rhizobium ruizarguesonis]
HLSALRAIPRLSVYRPGDPIETSECWEAIMEAPRQAALIALSRQPMPLAALSFLENVGSPCRAVLVGRFAA